MQPSSSMCRAQEARQHALSLSIPLENGRHVATLAAAAWAKEAQAAEKREERVRHRKLFAEASGVGLRLELPLPQDRDASENPDRGHADIESIRE